MRACSLVVSLLVLFGSGPALADVVTLFGLDACPAPGALVSGPGRAVTAIGNGATESAGLACFPDNYVGVEVSSLPNGGWHELCLPAVNCSAGQAATACVVCNYPNQSFAVAPAVSIFGLVILASALVGAAYYQRGGRRASG